MWAVWGAPTHWTQYAGLISSLVLSVGATSLIFSAEKGQGACVLGVLGMSSFYVPAVASIIPAENTIISPLSYVIVTSYLALVVATARYPKHIAGSTWIIVLVPLAMGVWGGFTAYTRWQSGEYNRPEIIGFLASRSEKPLEIPGEYSALVPVAMRSAMAKAGIGGSLVWRAGFFENKRKPSVVVIATSQISEPHRLHYPKQGTIIYIWNGEQWITLPANTECYPAYATLQVDGMLSNDLTTGGTQSYYFFPWQKQQKKG